MLTVSLVPRRTSGGEANPKEPSGGARGSEQGADRTMAMRESEWLVLDAGEPEGADQQETVPAAVDDQSPDEHDLVGIYLHDAARYPRLTPAEERDLSRRILDLADQDAAARLTQCNLRLVVRIAKGYQAQGLTLLDLVQEGNIGLMKAVQRYDGRKGFRFSTYAVWWITQQITRAIWSSHGPMKIPTRIIDEHRRTLKARAAKAAAAPVAEIEAVAATPEPPSPWSITAVSGDEAMDRIDALPDSEDESPPRYAENRELLGTIFMALQETSHRDQEILVQLFGLDDSTPLKLEQVATSHQLTCERVRQIKKKLFESVRNSPYAEQLASSY
jgi:RNA polymerase sigma factor (sigma-70 family)